MIYLPEDVRPGDRGARSRVKIIVNVDASASSSSIIGIIEAIPIPWFTHPDNERADRACQAFQFG